MHKLKLSDVRGTISLDGSAFDIVDRIEKGGEKLAENCRRAFGPDPADHVQASPLHHVRSGAGIAPFLLIYVKEDSLNHSQSRTFGEKLRDHGGKAELIYVDGKDHFRLAAELGTASDAASERIVRFVQSATTP